MLKDQVLSILMSSDDYVSGEAISGQLGVSRMTISTAVKTLRQEGYEIASVTRKGYRMLSAPDHLTRETLIHYLDPSRLSSVICLESTDSTNHYLTSLALGGAPTGTVVLSNEQTSGKGKSHSSFSSLKNKGIYLSYLYRPSCPTKLPELKDISKQAAEAVCRAITTVLGKEPTIRPVSDILMDGKKVCGILTEISSESESSLVNFCILGIGIFVHHAEEDFSLEERDKKTSLDLSIGITVSRANLTSALIRELDQIFHSSQE